MEQPLSHTACTGCCRLHWDGDNYLPFMRPSVREAFPWGLEATALAPMFKDKLSGTWPKGHAAHLWASGLALCMLIRDLSYLWGAGCHETTSSLYSAHFPCY